MNLTWKQITTMASRVFSSDRQGIRWGFFLIVVSTCTNIGNGQYLPKDKRMSIISSSPLIIGRKSSGFPSSS